MKKERWNHDERGRFAAATWGGCQHQEEGEEGSQEHLVGCGVCNHHYMHRGTVPMFLARHHMRSESWMDTHMRM